MAERRRAFDLKTILVVIGALAGGSLSGIGVKFINSNEYDTRVFQNEKKVEIVEMQVDQLDRTFQAYCESHQEKVDLRQENVEDKFKVIMDDIKEIKDMIKNGVSND